MIPVAVGAGGLFGLGVFLLIWRVLPATPVPGRALLRLHPEALGALGGVASPRPWWQRLWRPPTRELTLLGRTTSHYWTSVGLSALIGFGAPVVLGALFLTAGRGIPFVIPVGAALGLAALAAFSAHYDVISKAAKARYEFRRAVCSYLDLVSLELAAGHGPVAALERACTGVDGWVFQRLRETLLRAQLQLHQPWDELRELARTIDVPELGDVGDIVQAAGADGAVVHETLLARAESLRDQIRVEALARAKAVTTKLDIPGAALLLVLAVFIIYPLMARIGQ
ncbi:MAG: secretion system protein [Micromonosporaceae bacterium]|nr:secretion system protein [Micromonosporaceae bacterium]